MTQETINLIIEWFGHIQQMATDRKTITGAVMDAQHCLNEIAAIASNSKQFVEEYQYEQEPIDEEEIDRLADEYAEGRWNSYAMIERRAFKAGCKEILKKLS